jgi:dihydroorotase
MCIILEMDAVVTLQVHGEVADSSVDIFDRERVFIETVLEPLVRKLPQLRIVMEHITTKDAVDFISSVPEGTKLSESLDPKFEIENS